MEDLDRTTEVAVAKEEEEEEDHSEAEVVANGMVVVVAEEAVVDTNRTTEDKWVAEADINKTSRAVAEAAMHNLKQRCVEVFRMELHAITAINASMRILRMSSAFLNNSNELPNHNSNKNK